MNLIEAKNLLHKKERSLTNAKTMRNLIFKSDCDPKKLETHITQSFEEITDEINKLTEEIDIICEKIEITSLLTEIEFDDKTSISLFRIKKILEYLHNEILELLSIKTDIIYNIQDKDQTITSPLSVTNLSEKIEILFSDQEKFTYVLFEHEMKTECIEDLSKISDYILSKKE